MIEICYNVKSYLELKRISKGLKVEKAFKPF